MSRATLQDGQSSGDVPAATDDILHATNKLVCSCDNAMSSHTDRKGINRNNVCLINTALLTEKTQFPDFRASAVGNKERRKHASRTRESLD